MEVIYEDETWEFLKSSLFFLYAIYVLQQYSVWTGEVTLSSLFIVSLFFLVD